jgi:hypothetical protein
MTIQRQIVVEKICEGEHRQQQPFRLCDESSDTKTRKRTATIFMEEEIIL